MFEIKHCSTKSAITVKPIKKTFLNFDIIRKKFKVILDTPISLVLEEHGGIIVHNYGDIIFKKLKDKEKIKEIAELIYSF